MDFANATDANAIAAVIDNQNSTSASLPNTTFSDLASTGMQNLTSTPFDRNSSLENGAFSNIMTFFNSTHYFNITEASGQNKTGAQASAPAVNLSTYELWTQLIFFYGFLCGIVSTVCSVLIWMGILRKKKMRTRFFIIVGCLTFCRTWVCVQFGIMAIFRSLRTLTIVNTNQYRIVCHCVHFWLINGWTIEMFLLCTLVVDRVVAIVASTYYRLLTPKSAFQVCIAEYIIISILKLVPSYLGDGMMDVVQCVNLYSFLNEYFNEYSQYIDLTMVGVIMILYFILIFYVKIRVRDMKKATNDKATEAANVALKRQLKLMPILRNLVLMHCGLALTSKMLLSLSSAVPLAYQQRMTAYGGAVGCVDVFTNVAMLLFTNADVRQAALPCWKRANDNKIENSKGVTTMTVVGNPKTIQVKTTVHIKNSSNMMTAVE